MAQSATRGSSPLALTPSPVRPIIVERAFAPADSKQTWADISKAGRLLGWKPQVGLREGITRLVEWYRAERGWAKDIVLA